MRRIIVDIPDWAESLTVSVWNSEKGICGSIQDVEHNDHIALSDIMTVVDHMGFKEKGAEIPFALADGMNA